MEGLCSCIKLNHLDLSENWYVQYSTKVLVGHFYFLSIAELSDITSLASLKVTKQ